MSEKAEKEGLLLHPSLQKKLSDLREAIKKIPNEDFRLGYDCALRKIQEVVSEVVSQIQARKKSVADSDKFSENFRIGYVLACGDIEKLLVSPSEEGK